MSSTISSKYSARSKASERVSRYRSDLDRTPSYGRGDSSSSFVRIPIVRSRDSSLSSTFRRDSFTRGTSPLTTRRRDTSLSVANGSSPSINRRSVVLTSGLGSETAKYNREVALREISRNFDQDFKQNQMRYHGAEVEMEAEKMNKARAKILGQQSGPTTYLDDQFERRAAVGEMYNDMHKFSSRTVAAVGSLLDQGGKKDKKDYAWRKNMEDYEKSSEFERETKIRSIDSRCRKRREKEELEPTPRPAYSSRFISSNPSAKPPVAPSPKTPKIEPPTSSLSVPISQREMPKTTEKTTIPIKIERRTMETEKMDTSGTASARTQEGTKSESVSVKPPTVTETKTKKVITVKKAKKVASDTVKTPELEPTPRPAYSSRFISSNPSAKPPVAPSPKTPKIEPPTSSLSVPISQREMPKTTEKTTIPIKIERRTMETEKMDTSGTASARTQEGTKSESVSVKPPTVTETKTKKVITVKKAKKVASDTVKTPEDTTALPSSDSNGPRMDKTLTRGETQTTVKTEVKPIPGDRTEAEIRSGEENIPPKDNEPAKKEEDDDDIHGTKKMRSDFDLKMSSLEAEMEAGRSKLSKLRERIRRAKGAIKEADEVMAKSMQ
eukprot:maker-scaffold94_size379870-snap-gene-2.33 protein:Tk09639 transcript:maker-scaffold94_size379870-snap-gene-2.33-mRNA-1 annotation:"low quality protein: zonadhesin"